MTLAPCLSRMLLCLWYHHTIRCHPWQSSTSGCEETPTSSYILYISSFSFQFFRMDFLFLHIALQMYGVFSLLLIPWKECSRPEKHVLFVCLFLLKHTLSCVSDFCIMFPRLPFSSLFAKWNVLFTLPLCILKPLAETAVTVPLDPSHMAQDVYVHSKPSSVLLPEVPKEVDHDRTMF